MDAISFIAERKIEQALEEGQFDNLPGSGKPLLLEDLSHLPMELRMAYTILKNGGYLEQLPESKTIINTCELLKHCPDERRSYGKIRRLNVMLSRVKREQTENPSIAQGKITPTEAIDNPYLEKLLERV